ncbi:MAG: helix-turn-helix transcriptional regulator, partial [Clostridia bacterium]|nr:helix-turn-helix transcriptional regulator [Clostridia bacterium]
VFTEQEPGIYQKLDFAPNTLVIIPKNVMHDEKHFVESKLTAIGFTPDEQDKRYFNEKKVTEPVVYQDPNKKIQSLITKIEKEYSRHTPFYKEMIQLLISQILATVFSAATEPSSDEMIDFTVAYIDEHFTMKISIDEIAAQTYYSTDHFRVLFKQKIGKTPKAYILDKRLEYAKELIEQSNLSLSEISGLCGFTDYIQFNKFFKKKEGLLPSEYLKQRKVQVHGDTKKSE